MGRRAVAEVKATGMGHLEPRAVPVSLQHEDLIYVFYKCKVRLCGSGEKTNAKIYRNLMPLLILAYIISFIDRTNIGMAKNAMSIDLGLSATAFGIGAGLFS